MNRSINKSNCLVIIVLILFTAALVSEGLAQAAGQEQSEYQKAFQAGKKLYEDGEHKEAVIKFLQALTAAKEKGEIGEACFYLSLSYYGLGDAENTLFYMKKIAINPFSRNCAPLCRSSGNAGWCCAIIARMAACSGMK